MLPDSCPALILRKDGDDDTFMPLMAPVPMAPVPMTLVPPARAITVARDEMSVMTPCEPMLKLP